MNYSRYKKIQGRLQKVEAAQLPMLVSNNKVSWSSGVDDGLAYVHEPGLMFVRLHISSIPCI